MTYVSSSPRGALLLPPSASRPSTLQTAVVPSLAREIEAEDSRRSDIVWAAATLLRGEAPDTGGGYAVMVHNPYSGYLSYAVNHRTFEDGAITFAAPGLLNLTYAPQSLEGTLRDLEAPAAAPAADTTAPGAACQTASGLVTCSRWNGRPVGTCYAVADLDALAAELIAAFGGGDCARDWACAALATCYFSANPRHWCAHADKAECAAAFDGCGVSHVTLPDVPPSLEPAVESPPAVDDWVDADTPAAARTKIVDGEELRLVFSDEFEDATRDFRPGHDAKWEAADRGPGAAGPDHGFKPGNVRVEGGRAVFRYERNVTYDLRNAEVGYRGARLLGWNKLCYTGGYLEVRLSQPGTSSRSGVRSAVRAVGNLGRLGVPPVHCVRPVCPVGTPPQPPTPVRPPSGSWCRP